MGRCRRKEILAHFYSNPLLALCGTMQLRTYIYPWEEGMHRLLETQCFRTHSYWEFLTVSWDSELLVIMNPWQQMGFSQSTAVERSLALDGLGIWAVLWERETHAEVQLGTFSFPNYWSLAREQNNITCFFLSPTFFFFFSWLEELLYENVIRTCEILGLW